MVTKSRYVVEFLPTTDFENRDVIAFIVKRAYKLDTFEGRLEPLEEQPPIALEDEPHDDGDADAPSIRVENDFAPFKPRADIVFLGKAHAPGGKPVPEFLCGLRVGGYQKQLRIVGPRRCRYVPVEKQPKIDKKTGLPKEDIVQPPPAFSDPEPVAEVELRMKNAYGGWSYVVPADPDQYQQALADIEKQKEEKKKAEEEAKKKAEEEAKKKAEEEAKKPESKFSGAPEGAAKGADGALKLDDPAAAVEEPDEKDAGVDVAALRAEWGKVGTAGERRKDRDGATQAIDLESLGATIEAEDGDPEAAYRKTTAAKASVATVQDAGSTRFLKVGETVEAEDADWAERQRDELSAADRARREAEEEARRKAAAEKELPYPKVSCPQNPVGKGFAIHNLPETIDGLELPLIEDPARPIRPEDIPRELSSLMDAETIIRPAGLGFFPKYWWPRTALSGVMPREREASQQAVDEQIVKLDPAKPEEKAQLDSLIDFEVPLMKPEYHNGAMPGLQVEKLVGDEDVVLTNLDPQGTTMFKLPGDYPHVTLDRGKGREPVLVRLDTLVIDREAEQVTMLWRGALPYGGVAEFETYRRFDIDVKESAVDAYRESLAAELRRQREAERGTRAVDVAQLELEAEAERRYRDHVDAEAGGRAKAAAVASGVAVVVDGGTRMLDLAEAGGEKVVSDSEFHEWVDPARKGETDEPEDAVAATRKKKAELKQKLQAMKEKQQQEEAAAAAAEEAAAKKR